MKAKDFKYRNKYLSDYGFMICSFSGERDGISNGSEISFNQISTANGNYWVNAGCNYESVITSTFSICKDPCKFFDIMPITIEESTSLMRWLNSKHMYDIQFLDDEYENVRFTGSFTQIERVERNGNLYGFNLTFTTNRPFGIQPTVTKFYRIAKDTSVNVYDGSDEEGFTDVRVKAKIKYAGDLSIKGSLDLAYTDEDYITEEITNNSKFETIVKNCEAEEIITFEYPMIESSQPHSTLPDDFNYVFPKLFNVYDKRNNVWTANLPCELTISYNPIRKVGV